MKKISRVLGIRDPLSAFEFRRAILQEEEQVSHGR